MTSSNPLLLRLVCQVGVLLALLLAALKAQAVPLRLGDPFVRVAMLDLDAEQRQWLERRGPLRIGVTTTDNDPLDIAHDNRYQGVSADTVGLLSQRLGVGIALARYANRASAVEALKRGEIDLLTSSNSHEAEQEGLLQSLDYLADRLVVTAANPPGDPTLSGLRIAFVAGWVTPESLARAYPHSAITAYPSLARAVHALRQQSADVLIASETIVRAYLAARPYLELQVMGRSYLPTDGYTLAMAPGDLRLRDFVDMALASVDEPLARQIQARWTGGVGIGLGQRLLRLDVEQQRWLREHPRVRVATGNMPPYLYRNEQGAWVGLNRDVLTMIGRMTGIEFDFVEVSGLSEHLAVLREGRADMSTTLVDSEERRGWLGFSHAFGGQSWIFIVRDERGAPEDLADMGAKTLVLPQGHALLPLLRQSHPDIHLRTASDPLQARQMVASGEADATLLQEVVALHADLQGLRIGRQLEGFWAAERFAITPNHPQLLAILNNALEVLPANELRSLRLKWSAVPPPASPSWGALSWSGAAVSALAGGGVAVTVLWHFVRRARHRRQVAERSLADLQILRQSLLEHLPVPVFILDRDGRLLSANDEYFRLLGQTADILIGRRPDQAADVDQAQAQALQAQYAHVIESGQAFYGEQQTGGEGQQHHAWHWAVALDDVQGCRKGVLGGWIDVTERKRLEARLAAARDPNVTGT